MAKHESQRVLRPSQRRKRTSKYVAALGGLRAFAVLLALAGALVLCALVSPALFAKARADLLPSLFFVNN